MTLPLIPSIVPPPLALYVHLPWCVRKCPYCDFNSYEARGSIPERGYLDALLLDLEAQLPQIWGRRIYSIFIGGGTPSLFRPEAIADLLAALRARLPLRPDLEITLEANPGTIEHGQFSAYRDAGISRLSLGIQSFQPDLLPRIGRIHDADSALQAATEACAAGFARINLDLMFGLPEQTLEQGIADLEQALTFDPGHLSWYQLTLEPNTAFATRPPRLPDPDLCDELFLGGQNVLQRADYTRYEISAYARLGQTCIHNENYWEFGDYLGIGAGAHGKLTLAHDPTAPQYHVIRTQKLRQPEAYLRDPTQTRQTRVAPTQLPFEFMLNALRLSRGVPARLFSERTGLPLAVLAQPLALARAQGLLDPDPEQLRASDLGQRFLNNLLELFLESHDSAS